MRSQDFEKKVRKEIRIEEKIIFGKKIKISLYNDNSKEFFAAKCVLKSIFSDRLELKEVSRISKTTLAPTNLERELSKKLSLFFQNKTLKTKGIPFLNTLSEEEIFKYSKLQGAPKKILTKDEVSRERYFIEELQKIQKQTKSSLKKSFDHISRLENGKKKNQLKKQFKK